MTIILVLAIIVVVALVLSTRKKKKDAPPQQQAPTGVRTTPIEFGYFGVWTDNDIAETYDHVTFVMTQDSGDWTLPEYDAWRTQQVVNQLIEARTRGVRSAWVMVGWLLFSSALGPCYAGHCWTVREDALDRLKSLRTRLANEGLLGMVHVLYPVDEPELYGLDDATLTPLLLSVKATWPEAVLAVIYSGDNHGYPGLNAYDLVGKDHYDVGERVLEELPPIAPTQHRILVPGGADPWRAMPVTYLDYALQHPEVYAIVAFTWADYQGHLGIRNNGLADAYRTVAAECREVAE